MQNDLSADLSSAAETGGDFFLQKKVSEYKKLYFFLMLTGGIMLTCVIVYVILLFSSNKNSYQPLDNKLTITPNLAVDSSGRIIAFPVYDLKDSTISIMVSFDSGRRFEQLGGPWKNIGTLSDLIQSIQIAPDNKSIVAVGDEYIYLKAFDQDSFTCIKTTRFPEKPNNIIGCCFVAGTDSVYIYNRYGTVFGLNFKKYDSLSIGNLKGIDQIRSMAVNKDKQIIVISNSYSYDYFQSAYKNGVYINNLFSEVKKYAIADYNNKADEETGSELRNSSADSMVNDAIMMADSANKMMEILSDTTVKMTYDSTKK